MNDFWWLPENVSIGNLFVGVGSHGPVADEDSPKWLHSIKKGVLVESEERCGLSFLSHWRSICSDTNVYRTLSLYCRTVEEPILLGPFVVDIDNAENLADAQSVARQVATYLTEQWELSQDKFRLLFSGHKGFNVEILPESAGINGEIPDQLRLSSQKLDDIISFLRKTNNIKSPTVNCVSDRGTVIDRISGDRYGYRLKHPYMRLHNSINEWIRKDGSRGRRRKIEITIDQLMNCSAAEISLISEKSLTPPAL